METDTPWRFIRFERETRYYELRLQQDLFGWVIVKVWGRKESRLGQMRSVPCDSYPEALQEWRAGLRARQRRGYVEIETAQPISTLPYAFTSFAALGS